MENARDLVGNIRGFLAGVLSMSLSNSIWYPGWEERSREVEMGGGGERCVSVTRMQ